MTKLKNNAFTIAELIVAMGLLVILVGLSSMVFSASVKAHRKAAATIEITRNLRVLTEQLRSDVDGLRTDAPVFIFFNGFDTDTDPDDRPDVFYDTIHFFADRYFQTIKQYPVRWDSDGNGVLETSDDFRDEIIYSNVARVYYGHANSVDIFTDSTAVPDFDDYHVLSRKSHVLTSDDALIFDLGEIPAVTGSPMYDPFNTDFGVTPVDGDYLYENQLEFNTITLTQWINALNYLDSGTTPANAIHFIDECMDDDSRPYINLSDYETLHLLMTQGVLDFQIQWAYTSDDLLDASGNPLQPPMFNGVRWWPSDNPDGDPDTTDSDFLLNPSPFGVYFTLGFNKTLPAASTNWVPVEQCYTGGPIIHFSDTFYPRALKFTFRLKDSNNRFPDGKTFTHIVMIDN